MEKIREELICAVCLEFLREPKVLQCAHSFCLHCLHKIVSSYKRKSGVRIINVELECPSCRHVTNLKHGRLDCDLPTNYNLKRLVQIVSEEEKTRTRKVCSWQNHISCILYTPLKSQ